MAEFTVNGFSKLFEMKGYSELAQFYSTSFDFTDKIEAGLLRIEKEFEGQAGAGKFSISAYPEWEEQGKPYVSSYLSCYYDVGKFGIKSLDLSFSNGIQEIRSRTFDTPNLNEIPDSSQLKRELKVMTGSEHVELNNRNTKKFKL